MGHRAQSWRIVPRVNLSSSRFELAGLFVPTAWPPCWLVASIPLKENLVQRPLWDCAGLALSFKNPPHPLPEGHSADAFEMLLPAAGRVLNQGANSSLFPLFPLAHVLYLFDVDTTCRRVIPASPGLVPSLPGHASAVTPLESLSVVSVVLVLRREERSPS